MADMDVFEFAAMIEETPIKSRVIEYTRSPGPGEHGRPLAAVSLTDVFDDGLSMVYSFYDPDLQALSLGTFAILDHIDIAREAGLPYVYLGYWVPGSRKMGYKAGFSGVEIFKGGDGPSCIPCPWIRLPNRSPALPCPRPGRSASERQPRHTVWCGLVGARL
jgi:arginine-tRNA-protein transferase